MPVIKKEIILKGTTKEIFKRMSEYSFIQEMNSSANVCTKIIFKKPRIIRYGIEVKNVGYWESERVFIPEKNVIITQRNAGLSLGEYTALAASNVIDIKDLFLLVKKRGKYMQEAFPTGGAMAAVIGLSEREVVAICNQMNGNIYIANYNCPGQIVVTGEKAVVEASYEIFQKKGAKMVLPLNVSGPFHSPLLETAKKKLEISLKDVQINNFIIPYVSNVNAKYINYSCDIKSLLSEQIVSSVKWQQSIKEMIRQGVNLFIEVGPGSTLTNLIRKIDPGVEVLNIQAVGDMKTLLKVN